MPRDANDDRIRKVEIDARNLRGIAHPVRVRLLALLRSEGPSTATRLAARLGLNSGATSYHLRQLETYGFVAEDAARGTARERWWRPLHDSTLAAPADLLQGETSELGEEYLRALAMFAADATLRAVDEWGRRPETWRDVGTLSDYALRLTPAELDALLQDLFAVLDRARWHDADDAPADSRPVTVQLQAFPTPGTIDDDAVDG
ncbi:MAG TPA: winged helix-turn-helix domain-containing protein [Acidimicrobiia bacterium]|nr:winged helix-turn-helix domain-containing protein [Acidimicrobiia bacterium]